ncbi:putative protein argonaute 7-like [Capsicum annuum]|nr:putative protein argonaute 7-like [Capsicum annuum]KAF3630129.1 putative protein argonaute 7-like [Capsicum annuum]
MESMFSIHSCSLSSAELVEDVRELDFPSDAEPKYCEVHCCCDGLAIIRVYASIGERLKHYLWNPSTRESIVLPTPEFPMEGFSFYVFGEIPLPECLSNIGDIGISELEGMLCAYSNVYHYGRHTFKLWVMKDYGLKESLNALFSIENPTVIMPIPKYRFANGEVLFWCVYSQVPENAYWTQRGRFALFPRGLRQNGFTYTESLISPGLLT